MMVTLELLRELLVEVKPSLDGRTIELGDSLRDLGLDSLDVLQLGRMIQRRTRIPFALATYVEERTTDGPLTIGELLDGARLAESP